VAARRQNGIVSAIGDRSTIKPPVDRNPCISQRCASLTDGHDKVRSASLYREALGKLEVANTRAPVEAGRRVVVLVRVIEGALIHRINGQVAVVAPSAVCVSLAAGAVKKVLFTCQDVYGIGRQTSRIAELRVNRAAGGAETKYLVSQVIRRDAAHPPPRSIGLIGGFL